TLAEPTPAASGMMSFTPGAARVENVSVAPAAKRTAALRTEPRRSTLYRWRDAQGRIYLTETPPPKGTTSTTSSTDD
ncbi:MAG: DUF4124 domain-containing protein, partial [bacterium]